MPASRRKSVGTRPDIEEIFKQQAVSYQFWPSLPVSQFDIKKSLNNQTRIEEIDEDTADLYAEGVERGDPFPPVVAWRPGRGNNSPLIVIDGNHRLEAHKRAHRPIAVYEIDKNTPKPTIVVLAILLNTKHGLMMSEATRIRHALFLIDGGSNQTEAAALCNLKVSAVGKAIKLAKGEERARETEVTREWEALNAGVQQLLIAIKTDEGFGPAVKLAFQARLQWKEVQELVSFVNASNSGAKQRKVVELARQDYQERIAAAGGGVLATSGKRGMGPRQHVLAGLKHLISMPVDTTGLIEKFTPAEKPELAQRCLEVSDRLRKMAQELNPEIGA